MLAHKWIKTTNNTNLTNLLVCEAKIYSFN